MPDSRCRSQEAGRDLALPPATRLDTGRVSILRRPHRGAVTCTEVRLVAVVDPWVLAVIATPAELDGLSRSSELRG
jgi:hypothetical protein